MLSHNQRGGSPTLAHDAGYRVARAEKGAQYGANSWASEFFWLRTTDLRRGWSFPQARDVPRMHRGHFIRTLPFDRKRKHLKGVPIPEYAFPILNKASPQNHAKAEAASFRRLPGRVNLTLARRKPNRSEPRVERGGTLGIAMSLHTALKERKKLNRLASEAAPQTSEGYSAV